ncbi:MAG: hypothetical protein ACP5JR_06595 [Thermoplasmata archaeon]
MTFNISFVDKILGNEKRQRFLLITNDTADALFIVQNFLSGGGHIVLTKPFWHGADGAIPIDWYSHRTEQIGEMQNSEIIMPSDPVLFFSALKKIENLKKLFFYLTPVFILHEKDTGVGLVENLSAYCEKNEIALLCLMEPQPLENEVISTIFNNFDFLIEIKSGILKISTLKKMSEDVFFRYMVRENDVVVRTDKGIERCFVNWVEGKNLFWLPGFELLIPSGVSDGEAIYFTCPPGRKAYLVEQCVSDAILSGKPCVVVSADTNLDTFRKNIGKRVTSIPEKKFVFVDWFSNNSRKIVGIEENGCEMQVSRDIVYLGVAIDWALKKVGKNGVLVFDAVNRASQDYSFEEVCTFVAVLLIKARKHNYSIVSIANPELLEERLNFALGCLHNIHISCTAKEIKVVRADAHYHPRRELSLVSAADVLTVVPGAESQDKEVSEEEMRKVLKALDDLLGALPEEKITDFALSEEFRIYEKLLKRYGI